MTTAPVTTITDELLAELERECLARKESGHSLAPNMLASTILALLQQIRELRKDAERYQWLKNTAGFGIRRNGVTELSVAFYEIQPYHMRQLDDAIDAAMQATDG